MHINVLFLLISVIFSVNSLANNKPVINRYYYIKSPDNKFLYLDNQARRFFLGEEDRRTKFKIIETKNNKFLLELSNHNYINAFDDRTVGPWPGPEDWQSFTLLPTKDNRYFLESIHKNYLSINPTSKMLDLSNNKSIGETFEFIEAAATESVAPINNHWYNLKSSNNKYIYLDKNSGRLLLGNEDKRTIFKAMISNNNSILLQLPNNQYVSPFEDKTLGSWPGPEKWQYFTLLPAKDKKYILKSSHNTHVSTNLDKNMLDLSPWTGDLEEFVFLPVTKIRGPNAGIVNVTATDCFFSSSFQVLSQIKPLIDTLNLMDQRKKTHKAQNEFLTFVDNLREIPVTTKSRLGNVYDPADQASLLFRKFITNFVVKESWGNNVPLEHMKGSGQQDAQEFLSIFLDILTRNNHNLANLFTITEQSKQAKNLGDPWTNLGMPEKSKLLLLGIPIKSKKLLSLKDLLNDYTNSEYIADLVMADKTIGGYKKNLLVSTTKSPLPEILVINLKRIAPDFKNKEINKDIKIRRPVTFPMNFDPTYLAPYVTGNLAPSGYKLFGIVIHGGDAKFDKDGILRTSGHYWAYTIDRFDGKWRLYNDNQVFDNDIEKRVQEIAIAGNETQDIINKIGPAATGVGTPYLLFYEKIPAKK